MQKCPHMKIDLEIQTDKTIKHINPDLPADHTGRSGYLYRDDWSEGVKRALNDFISMYGKNSPEYQGNAYVVFDFDDTCAIFDAEVMGIYHRLKTMQFAFTPEQLPDILVTGLGNLDVMRTGGFSMDGKEHSYQDWIDDIVSAYTYLWNSYGPFDYKGLAEVEQSKMQKDPMWAEFAVKMRMLFMVANTGEGDFAIYPWYKCWNTGMTEQEVYEISKGIYLKYKDVETYEETWTTSSEIKSKVGQVVANWIVGISVTPNIRELMKALHENGIDVWICSASGTDQIRAAIDIWSLHEYVTGILAYTLAVDSEGRIRNQYDYETGTAWYTAGNGWIKGKVPMYAQTNGPGKAAAITNALVTQYGCGPLAGFMNAAGDYEFCTVFKSLKLVVIFNVNKSINSSGILNCIALYQRNGLEYDLKKANQAGDTYYVLQGRDENGLRSLRNSDASISLGSETEKLHADADCEQMLKYMMDHKLPIKKYIDMFTIQTAANADNNVLGISYGFRTFYAGYHSYNF